KVPDPTHTCMPNGCGGEGGTSVPNSFGIANFRNCCNGHDCCYDECNSNKGGCDRDLFACMSTSCIAAYALFPTTLLPTCLEIASTYFAFVTALGAKYYNAAQQQSCDCCSTQTCSQACAGGACGRLPACAGGSDCVCFTSVEGT